MDTEGRGPHKARINVQLATAIQVLITVKITSANTLPSLSTTTRQRTIVIYAVTACFAQ